MNNYELRSCFFFVLKGRLCEAQANGLGILENSMFRRVPRPLAWASYKQSFGPQIFNCVTPNNEARHTRTEPLQWSSLTSQILWPSTTHSIL